MKYELGSGAFSSEGEDGHEPGAAVRRMPNGDYRWMAYGPKGHRDGIVSVRQADSREAAEAEAWRLADEAAKELSGSKV